MLANYISLVFGILLDNLTLILHKDALNYLTII